MDDPAKPATAFEDAVLRRAALRSATIISRGRLRPPPSCFWCGHVFTLLEFRADHRLWCGRRPADA